MVAATLTVALTTADDAVWLVRYTSPSLPLRTRVINACLFVITLEVLACACVAIAVLIERTVFLGGGDRWAVSEDIILGCAGAGICWAIALILYVKKVLKKRKRRELSLGNVQSTATTDYGAVADCSDSSSSSSGESTEEILENPSPWSVVMLTTLGALDEISYFPALVIGKIFSPLELCLGTFLAGCIVLAVVVLFLSQFKPLLDFFDRIPLYCIVAIFALTLTLEVVVDIISDTSDAMN